MTDKLPPQMMRFFAPNPPLPFLPPVDVRPELRRNAVVSSLEPFVDALTAPPDPTYKPTKTFELMRIERAERKKARAEEERARQEREYADSLKRTDAGLTEDAFKTIFVARLAKAVDEEKLRGVFEGYGPLKQICVVHKPVTKTRRPYAFIEFENESDVKGAVRGADGMKVEGTRVVVDVERGRTVTGWKPRRIGGGIGPGRNGPASLPAATSPVYDSGPRRDLPPRYPPPSRDYQDSRGGYDRGDRGRGGYDRGDRGGRRGYSPDAGGRKRSRDRYRSRSRSPKRRDDYRGGRDSYRR